MQSVETERSAKKADGDKWLARGCGGPDFAYPINRRPKRKDFVVYDLESKSGDTQGKGLDRPFLSCFYDGDSYEYFKNENVKGRAFDAEYWNEKGGCIDGMMRSLLSIRRCVHCNPNNDLLFGSCKECIAERRKFQASKRIIYAHNGGKFDSSYVLGWVKKNGHLFSYEIINVQSRLLSLTIRPLKHKCPDKKADERWVFSDSIALIPLSLKEVGDTFFKNDKDKKKQEFDLDSNENDPLWILYNKQDCKALYEALHQFRGLIERIGGAAGMTAASTAMQVYRRAFQKEKVKVRNIERDRPIIIHRNLHWQKCLRKCIKPGCQVCATALADIDGDKPCHGCLHDFIRLGYYGGRTEIFRFSGKRLWYYDVNSSYPFSMLGDMPYGKAREFPEGLNLSQLDKLGKQYIGFVECVVYVPEKCYLPPLPYRKITSAGMKLVFPVGNMYGVWDWEELKLLKEIGGRIVTVGRSVWYQKKPIFTSFIRKLYAYRAKNIDGEYDDPGLAYIAKLLMNSLYGKWATNSLREKIEYRSKDDEEGLPPNVNVILPPLNSPDPYYRLPHLLEADYIVPQISAHITTMSRIVVYNGLRSALKSRGGQVIYTDTDSIIANRKIAPEGDELGQWKCEEENVDVEILQPKWYRLRRHKRGCRNSGLSRHCKGCRREMPNGKKVAPIKVRMKGCPKDFQKSDVFDFLQREDGLAGFIYTAKGKETLQDVADHYHVSVESLEKLNDGRKRKYALKRDETVLVAVPKSEVELKKTKKRNVLQFKRLTMHRTMLRLGLRSPKMEEVQRTMASQYDKRIVLPNGDTKPLVMSDPTDLDAARKAHGVFMPPMETLSVAAE